MNYFSNSEKLIKYAWAISLNRLSMSTHPIQVHKYVLTNKEINSIFQKEIYKEIIKSTAFQRLKQIHFLGAIDYTINQPGPKPNKRHTRFQHSLGVALLALQYAREKKFSELEEVMCVVSALLHDIGHAPLSHSLESVFKREFGIGHHISGERIIKGDVEIGKNLHTVLNKWDINPFEIMTIISGVGVTPYREIFSYAINIDTIEAILRSTTYLSRDKVKLTPPNIMSAFIKKDKESTFFLDEFWRLKDRVYSGLINDKLGVLADYVCQKYMSDNVHHFNESYYYGTEKQLKEDHSSLFGMLEKISNSSISSEILPDVGYIPCVKRRFFIDKDVALKSESSLNDRYKQEKIPYSYLINSEGGGDGDREFRGHTENKELF